MTRDDALSMDEALRGGDVSRAWSAWSSAAVSALADAHQFAGCPVHDRGLVLGRFFFWFVLLGWVALRFVKHVATLRIHRRE